jgi:hypothetical protein
LKLILPKAVSLFYNDRTAVSLGLFRVLFALKFCEINLKKSISSSHNIYKTTYGSSMLFFKCE